MIKIKKIIIKYYILLILLIIISFILKNNYFNFNKIFFYNYIDYAYIRSKTNVLLGKLHLNNNIYVSSNKLEYKSVSKVNNDYKFITDENYLINNLENGIVIFINDNSLTINGDNGVNYTYSNLKNINVSLYDYISKDIVIGCVENNYFYLTLMKDNKYLNYEDYI